LAQVNDNDSQRKVRKNYARKNTYVKIKRCAKQSSRDEVYDCRSYCISVLGIETPTCLIKNIIGFCHGTIVLNIDFVNIVVIFIFITLIIGLMLFS